MILHYTFGSALSIPCVSESPAASLCEKSERPRTAALAREIIRACARAWDVAPSLLIGPRRQAYITLPRHAAMALLRNEGLSLVEIAAIFRRDHTSVIHAVRRHQQFLLDTSYREKISEIEQSIRR